MKYSDYCNLRAMLGLPQIPLSEEQYIIHCLPYLKDTFTNLQIDKDTLVCKDIFTEAFSQYGGYGNGQDFVIVVPDHYIENMEAMYSLYVVQSETVIDMSELENEFPQVRPLNSNKNPRQRKLLLHGQISKYTYQPSYFNYFAIVLLVVGYRHN